MKIKNYKFLILIVLSFFILFSTELKAADEHTISSSFPVEMCVTDDANKDTVMNRCTVEGYSIVNPLPLGYPSDSVTVYPPVSNHANIITNTNTSLLTQAGFLFSIVINKVGTTSTVVIKDSSAADCSTGIILGTADTILSRTLGYGTGAYMTNGLCLTTAGAAAADITVIYK